jgi:hypothetical protein
MLIVTKLKVDQKSLPYWSCMLVNDEENNTIMREVVSQTFDINNKYNKWKQFEMAHNRMAKEIMNEGGPREQYQISQMLLRESEFDKTENRN